MKSFKTTIYFNRDKESNYEIVNQAKELGFKNAGDLRFLGYEIEVDIEIFEDLSVKALNIDGTDVSEFGIYI
jgi:hypothetical protein